MLKEGLDSKQNARHNLSHMIKIPISKPRETERREVTEHQPYKKR